MISRCNLDQIQRLLLHFYGTECARVIGALQEKDLKGECSPSEVVSLLQRYADESGPEKVISKLFSGCAGSMAGSVKTRGLSGENAIVPDCSLTKGGQIDDDGGDSSDLSLSHVTTGNDTTGNDIDPDDRGVQTKNEEEIEKLTAVWKKRLDCLRKLKKRFRQQEDLYEARKEWLMQREWGVGLKQANDKKLNTARTLVAMSWSRLVKARQAEQIATQQSRTEEETRLGIKEEELEEFDIEHSVMCYMMNDDEMDLYVRTEMDGWFKNGPILEMDDDDEDNEDGVHPIYGEEQDVVEPEIDLEEQQEILDQIEPEEL